MEIIIRGKRGIDFPRVKTEKVSEPMSEQDFYEMLGKVVTQTVIEMLPDTPYYGKKGKIERHTLHLKQGDTIRFEVD